MFATRLSSQSIIPGRTTYADVLAQYGAPSQEVERDGLRYALYQVDAINFDAVGFKDGIAAIVILNVASPKDKPDAMVPNLGEPEITFYSHYGHGARTLAYPSRGVTFTVTFGGVVADVEYYVPTDAETYRKTLGRHFPVENPFAQL